MRICRSGAAEKLRLCFNTGSTPCIIKPEDEGEHKPEEGDDPGTPRPQRTQRWNRDQPPDLLSGDETTAGLSNFYTITLNEDNSVASWTSDRTDLYTDEQVYAFAASVMAEGRDSGRIGTQYYQKTETDGQTLIIVLDARLDFLSVSNVLRTTILVMSGETTEEILAASPDKPDLVLRDAGEIAETLQ